MIRDVKEKGVEGGVSGAKDDRASSTPADCALRILPVADLIVSPCAWSERWGVRR